MIVRAFRLTDKFGNALLKMLIWLGQQSVAYVDALTVVLTEVVAGNVLQVLLAVVRIVLVILGALLGVLLLIGRVIRDIYWRVSGSRLVGRGVTGTGRSAVTAEQRRLDGMASRAEELSETVVLVEDPLKVRNRTLSALLVLALAAVVILLIWATSPDRSAAPAVVPGAAAVLNTPDTSGQPTPFATAVPTVTPRPESLRVGGSLVYTLRQNGQDDLWATVIGHENPIRLTNHPADDRDPAWSPDGRYLAFSSHRDGNWELYVKDVRTGTLTRLTYTLDFEGGPSWSPDGQWLVYEGYSEDNLDIYITRLDGTQGPIRLTYDPAPDFDPVWSPGGREIAFVSWRDGNQDIYILSLDDPTEQLAVNLTNTPDLNEEYPAWSPNGLAVAYSALTEGLEIVYVRAIDAPGEVPEVIDRGRAPAWSPDGGSLIFAVDQGQQTFLVAGRYQGGGVATEAVALPAYATDPDWTAAGGEEYVRALGASGAGGAASASEAPYTEEISFTQDQPPYYRLVLLGDVEAPNPYLSDRVNDSFMALREAVLEQTGVDYLGELEDAFWALGQPPEPGQERLNWHMTGRAFSINRNLIYGFPAPLEVVREDIGIHTYWRIYARTAVQDGQLGEPLRRLPWDFSARTGGDVEAYEQGGRLRSAVPTGYYVDLTRLFADYGWMRVPADRSWRYNFGGVLFWEFVKTDGLTWEEAMLEIYSEEELNAFLTQPTPFPTNTLAPPTATPEPTHTPTPIPPDLQSSES